MRYVTAAVWSFTATSEAFRRGGWGGGNEGGIRETLDLPSNFSKDKWNTTREDFVTATKLDKRIYFFLVFFFVCVWRKE